MLFKIKLNKLKILHVTSFIDLLYNIKLPRKIYSYEICKQKQNYKDFSLLQLSFISKYYFRESLFIRVF